MTQANSKRVSALTAVAFGAVLLVPSMASAQNQNSFRERSYTRNAAGKWTGARLADGQPDVQGHWSNTIGNHNNLTDPNGGLPGERRRNEEQRPPRSERAPSRITDPADGQIPFQPWARAKQQEFLANFFNPVKEEYVEPLARCAPAGPTKSFMWHGYEIRQFPRYVVFMFDSGTRVIHLDDKPRLPESVKLWNGDSRGRWEGNTLVVSVRNNNSKWRFGRTGEFVTEQATVEERFTFDNNGQRFTYDATYTDPGAMTRPFTITIPNKRITADTPRDGWNNLTHPVASKEGAKLAGKPDIEAYERICVENNGPHGDVAVSAASAPLPANR